MAIKPVLRYGDPKLLKKSRPIKQFDTPELHSLIQDMKDTMHSLNGAGLAAPQIGVNLQLVIFGSQDNPRYPDADAVPFTILINPKLTFVNDTQEEGWEGCLSVPGMRGLVPRYVQLKYQGWDPFGKRISRVAEGFHARVVQHECDHLQGILYPMRIPDLSYFGFNDALFPGQILEED
jgi:peptide deformylase